MAGATNTGVVNYISNPVAVFPKNAITIDIFGNTFYRKYTFGAGDDTGVYWNDRIAYSHNTMLFFATAMQKTFEGKFSYGKKLRSSQSKDYLIKLPITENGDIDFTFMESFIAELEAKRVAELETERIAELSAYLKVSGMDNYELSKEEEKALADFTDSKYSFTGVRFDCIFNHIKQGRRLKKEDQKQGNIPFVMSGTTNNGIVGFISNPAARFPSNSITVDIFGNAFYRNFNFGAGDDTGVYWNDKITYSKKTMLYFSASMEKALRSKFSYGKKLRSSQSAAFEMQIITKNGKPDFATMELLISAVQKMVIKETVHYTEERIQKTKEVIRHNRKENKPA